MKKFKILFLNPINYAATSVAEIPPLGLAYIIEAIRDLGHYCKVIDFDINREIAKDFENLLCRFNPDAIGISITTPQVIHMLELLHTVSNRCSKAKVIVGGPHATVAYESLLKIENINIDAVVIGEGEETFRELVIKEFSSFETIAGLAWKEDGIVKRSNSRPPMLSLDKYGLKDREIFDWWLYPGFYPAGDGPNFGMMSTRGCPFACKFCSSANVFGRKHRRREIDSILNEIENLQRMYGAEEISFFDDLFTANKRWLDNFCTQMLNRKIKIKWKCLSRVDTVDENILKKMKAAGCWLICFGIESGDKQILSNVDKKIDLNKAKLVLQATKSVGIRTFHFYMIGHVGENPENFKNTINFAKETAPDIYQLGITTPFPGSHIYESNKTFAIQNYGDFDYRIQKFSKDDHPSAGCPMTLGTMEALINEFKSELRKVGSKDWQEFSLSKKFKAKFRVIASTKNKLTIEITNDGDIPWSEEYQIRIGIREHTENNSITREHRIYFPKTIKKHDSYVIQYEVDDTVKSGHIDIVKENYFWFNDIQDSGLKFSQNGSQNLCI